jgi:ABC-type polysaccharide/polyol phosphate export permease
MRSGIQHFWELLWAMTEKELKIRYKHTVLGFLWTIIYPILQATIIGFIFQFFSKEQSSNYSYILFLNLLIWNFFSQTLDQTTPSIIYQRAIIKKAKFPIITIPLSIILCNAFHFFVGLLLFFLFTFFNGIIHHISIFSFLSGLLLLFLFTTGISFITSTLNVKTRDINFLTQAGLMIWFYLTPILYSLSIIPKNIQYVWSINPLSSIITLFQNTFFNTEISVSLLFFNSVLTLCIFIFGLWLFQAKKDYFDDFI